jgi:biopolymer transport protein ExbD
MSHGPSQGEACEPNLTPLLDVVLQLVMFFMITVNFVRIDQLNEDIKLPVAQAAVPMDQSAEDWVFLNLDKHGKLEGTETKAIRNPSELKAYLQRKRDDLERTNREKGKTGELKVVVVLRADANTHYRDVWETLKSCTEAGYRRWQLRVMTVGKTAPNKKT